MAEGYLVLTHVRNIVISLILQLYLVAKISMIRKRKHKRKNPRRKKIRKEKKKKKKKKAGRKGKKQKHPKQKKKKLHRVIAAGKRQQTKHLVNTNQKEREDRLFNDLMNDEDILPNSGEENERNDQPPPLNERQPDEGDQEVPYDMSIIQNGVQGRNNEQSKGKNLSVILTDLSIYFSL